MRQCSVCLEMMDILKEHCVKTKCNHVYHNSCFQKWYRIKKECPYCRSQLIDSQIESMNRLSCPIRMNGYLFEPKCVNDLKLCILFLFFVKTGIILHNVLHLNEMIVEILEGVSNINIYNFYKGYTLELWVNTTTTDNMSFIEMNDIYQLFGLSTLLLLS